MDVLCTADMCPVILNSTCVFYEGPTLIYTGITTNDSVQTALQKIDAKFGDAMVGYTFTNGVYQSVAGAPVGLGGSLIANTSIGGNFTLTFTGNLQAAKHITTGGISSQFVKGDGTLDSTAYQAAGNYITALTGDVIAAGPGSVNASLAVVNSNPGTYGSSTRIPVITVDTKGRVTDLTTTAVSVPSAILSFVGDVYGSGTTGSPTTLTLSDVNLNVYTNNTFLKFKVNAKGLVTGATPVTNLDIEGALGYIPTPETRTITINGVVRNLETDAVFVLPSGGGSVTSVSVTSGTGISASVANPTTNPNITITNTAPDRIVSIASGTGINVTGTYPNFTVAATNTGAVTSVTASAPLASSGGTTPNITISQAGASSNGYLSSTDWNTFNNKQPAGHYITDLDGEATGTGPGVATVTLSTPAVTGKLITGVNVTGGTIDGSDSILTALGKLQNQINGLIGGTTYQGVWDAATNTPTLVSGVGTDGYYYIVDVAGNTNLNGITNWNVGDWAIFHDTAWQKIDNTDAVVSVNGYTGAVSLVSSDIPEGATNLYYTNTRSRQALSAGSGISYDDSTGIIINSAPDQTVSISSGTGISATGTYPNFTIASTITQYTDALARGSISLTTNGTSGASTYSSSTGVLNIPNYSPDLSGYVTIETTQTITGTKTFTSPIVASGEVTVTNGGVTGSTGVGYFVLNGNSGFNNTAFGYSALGGGSAGNRNTGIGSTALVALISGFDNTAVGNGAGSNITTGSYNTLVGGYIGTPGLSSNIILSDGQGNIRFQWDGSDIKLNGNTVGSNAYTSTAFTPQTRTLTINGTTYDLSANRTWSVGTVTSVAALTLGTTGTDLSSSVATETTTPVITLNVPTASATNRGALSSADWSTFNGKQALLSGTGIVKSTAGTISYLTDNSTNWNTAYNRSLTSAEVTGTTTKTLTLNQQDGATITASWTDVNTDAVTSVFGRTGAVVAASGDYTTTQVTEGTNLYYTEARVDANSNVAANTAARHNAVTIGTANGLSLSTQVLSLGLSSTSTTGALSSTDWTTFNSKQDALTDPVTGTGTTNDIVKFTSASTIGDSNITDDGSLVTINSNNRFNGLGTRQGTIASDTAPLGAELAAVTASGTNWTLAGTNLNDGGYTHTTGSVVALTSTLAAVTGTYYQVAWTITGRTTGSVTINYGGASTGGNITVSGAAGPLALNTAVLTVVPTTDFNGTVAISVKIIGLSSPSITYLDSVGTIRNEFRINNLGNFLFGPSTGRRLTTGIGNVGISNTLQNITTGSANVAIGPNVMGPATTATNNIAIGNSALTALTTGGPNIAIGGGAMVSVTTSFNNIGIGNSALAATTSSGNTAIGASVMSSNTSGGFNTAVGQAVLVSATTGSNNTAIGRQAGSFLGDKTTAFALTNNSVFLGYRTSPLGNNETNQVVIGYDATGLGSNTTVLGNTSTTLTALYGAVITGGTSVAASAQLQADSTTKGFLPPRMTSAQRTAIASPATGLMVYQTDGTEGVYVKTSTTWKLLTMA